MPIAYDSGTNIITVTAYSEATPCNFTDIYNADVAGSWGKVIRQCTNQFCISAKMVIGDGTTVTYFADEKQQVRFMNVITANYQSVILVKTNGHCRFGELIDGAKKITRNGCNIFYNINSYRNQIVMTEVSAELEIYQSSFSVSGITPYSRIFGASGTTKIYNSTFNGLYIASFSNIDLYNCLIEHGEYGAYSISGTIDKLIIANTTIFGLLFYNYLATMKNVVYTGKLGGSTIRAGNVTGNCYLINSELESWDISWGGSGYPIIYRQYEFDLRLVDSGGSGISTVGVKIWDSSDSIVTNTTTDVTGALVTQTLNYGYYTQSMSNTPTMRTPHEIRIYKYGKMMSSSKSNIESKTDWAFTMLSDPNITQTVESTVAAYTGITINHTAETITISENHTLDEIYDYCQYDIITATKQLDQTMHTADGVNFISEYSFVVNTGITVTATDQKLIIVTGKSYTLTGTANFAGIIADTVATRIPLALSGIVDGTRYRIEITSSGTMITEGTQSGSNTITSYYEHTADIGITIIARKGSAAPRYLPYRSAGTLLAEKFTLTVNQIVDDIIT